MSGAGKLAPGAREQLLVKCWMTHDARWFNAVAREFGMEVANRLNQRAVREMAKVEWQRVGGALGIAPPRDAADCLRAQEALIGVLETAFLATVACEPIEKKFREAVKSGQLTPRAGVDTALAARDKGVITPEEYAQWQKKEVLRKRVIMVDDFPQDFGRAEILDKLSEAQPKQAKAA